jgi:predicted amidohydrolase
VFKLALAQLRVEGGAKEANLARAEHAIAEAAAAGAHVVLLPEALNLGWMHGSARTHADAFPDGESCTRLRKAARHYQVYVCAGLIERAADQLFNAAVLISPTGEILLHHRKLNELNLAHDLYAQGDRLGVVSTPLGTLGLMICSDAFAPAQMVSRTLGLMGADVILSPCAWAVPAEHDNTREPYGQLWLDNYCPVARNFRLWIAGCSNVGSMAEGPWRGRKCIGSSYVIDPEGAIAVQGPYGVDAETIMLVDIIPAPRPARGDQWAKSLA